jgi:Protein of unknown function (DUF1275)
MVENVRSYCPIQTIPNRSQLTSGEYRGEVWWQSYMNRSGLNHVARSSAAANSFANSSNWHTGNRSHPAIAARLLGPAGCQAMGHGVDDTSVDSAATKAAQHYPVTPAFEHIAFPGALGFVAGFVDIFGFMALFGLLPAHVTGNLIFIAVDIARHQYNLIMKIAALPIFAASVAISAWLIGTLNARRSQPFLPVVLLQAAVLGLSLIAGLLMPAATRPDDATVVLVGSTMLFAMAVQNTMMRLILQSATDHDHDRQYHLHSRRGHAIGGRLRHRWDAVGGVDACAQSAPHWARPRILYRGRDHRRIGAAACWVCWTFDADRGAAHADTCSQK